MDGSQNDSIFGLDPRYIMAITGSNNFRSDTQYYFSGGVVIVW